MYGFILYGINEEEASRVHQRPDRMVSRSPGDRCSSLTAFRSRKKGGSSEYIRRGTVIQTLTHSVIQKSDDLEVKNRKQLREFSPDP
ncbi:hypothetical protein VZT92_000003 [Zoarces viviparus]|uniref:Uncharacterized protein n=1 Tax=Zoarces viviparus TaxID=48416 RepID=A0AAW1G5L1_ZOAVI